MCVSNVHFRVSVKKQQECLAAITAEVLFAIKKFAINKEGRLSPAPASRPYGASWQLQKHCKIQ